MSAMLVYSAVPVLHATVAGSMPCSLSSFDTSALSVATPLRASRMNARSASGTSSSPAVSTLTEAATSPLALRTSLSKWGFSSLPVATAP